MRRTILAALLPVLATGCDAAPSDPIAPLAVTAQASALPAAPTLETFFGPQDFVRDTGKPVVETVTIDPSGFEAPFILHVRNGDEEGRHRVSSAVIRFGGETLLGPNDFSQQVEGHTKEVTLDGATTLEVELGGAPGGRLTVWAEGQRAGLRFCPLEVGTGAYTDLQSAINAVDQGGTILVCDGVHSIGGAAIFKPLTLRAEHPLQATLDMHGTLFVAAGGFFPNGLVAVRDLNLTASAGVMISVGFQATTQDYDQVEITNNVFDISTPFPIAIRIFDTGIAGADVAIRGNTFSGGGGVIEANRAPSVEVDGNVFHDASFRAVGLFDVAHATVTDNDVSSHGTGIALVRVPDGLVEDNTVRIENGGAGSAGIEIDGRTIVARGNDVRGVGPLNGPPSGFGGWPMSYGIVAFMPTPTEGPSVELYGNHVERAWSGINLSQADAVGSDNVVTDTWIGIFAFSATLGGVLDLHRNDVTAYGIAIDDAGSAPGGSLTCNWWGDAGGPTALGPGVPPGLYTPFASEPVANQPGVICP